MKISSFKGLAVLAATLALVGCASTSNNRTHATTHRTRTSAQANAMGTRQQQHQMTAESSCPMLVPGTTAVSKNVEGGVALEFKTTFSGDVSDLRERVQRMAQMHNQHQGGMAMGGRRQMGQGQMGQGQMGQGQMGQGQQGQMARGGMMMHGGMMGPPATASVENIDGGAQLVLRPHDPNQLDALREHARMQAENMAANGQCPMMMEERAPSARTAPARRPGTPRVRQRYSTSPDTTRVR